MHLNQLMQSFGEKGVKHCLKNEEEYRKGIEDIQISFDHSSDDDDSDSSDAVSASDSVNGGGH